MTITAAQIRGARGVLNWTQGDLAERTDISATSIGSIENGSTQPRESTLATIQRVFEEAGIEFIDNDGIRLRTGEIRVFRGRTGFIEFFDYVYSVLKDEEGDVYVSNVEEKRFLKWAGESATPHMERMSKLKGVTYKVLLKEGDYDFVSSSYSEYRWVPREQFSSVPFYVFDKSFAIILLDPEPQIVVMSYPAVAEAYKLQFLAMWENATTPDARTSED